MSPHIPADLATSQHDFDGTQSGADFVTSYNGAHGHSAPCTKDQWVKVRPSFTSALAPLSSLTPRALRRYATAYARLATWALDNCLGLEPSVLLSPEITEAFLAAQPAGTADLRSTLRRLGRANGVTTTTGTLGYHKRRGPAPYGASECEALLAFARNVANFERKVSLQALLALGLGCGLARESLRGVSAASLHRHGAEPFVRSGTRCAKIRTEYLDLLEEVIRERPIGELLGPRRRNITTEIVSWTTGRVGVPALSPDRLRATYICHWIETGAPLLDLMAWTGTKTSENIGQYLAHIAPATPTCPEESLNLGGAL